MADAYTSLASTTLSSTAGSITFSSIPGTYTDLLLVFRGTCHSSAMDVCYQVNGDTGGNYGSTFILNYGTSSSSGREASATQGGIATFNDGAVGIGQLHFMNYSNTTTYKTALSPLFGDTSYKTWSGSVTTWRSTAAITSISLINLQSRLFSVGSTMTLYGIKAA